MKTIRLTFEKTARNYGLLIAALMVAYFLLMRWAGLALNIDLRLLNFLFIIIGIYLSLKKIRQQHPEDFTFLRGLILGILTTAIGSVIFGVFLFFYLQIDHGFLEAVETVEPLGPFINPYIIAASVVVEGIASSLIITFILLAYLDPERL